MLINLLILGRKLLNYWKINLFLHIKCMVISPIGIYLFVIWTKCGCVWATVEWGFREDPIDVHSIFVA